MTAENNHNIDFTIIYAIIGILSLTLSFANYTEGKMILTIIWLINSILNIYLGYKYYKQR